MRPLLPISFLLASTALAQGPDCGSAVPISGAGVHSFDLAGRVPSGPVGSGICGVDLGPNIGDVFWQWTCSVAGDYLFEIDTAFHTSLLIYEGSGCAATWRTNKSGKSYSVVVPGLQPGDPLLLHLGQQMASADASGTLSIGTFSDACTAAPDDALEDNDTYQTAIPLTPGSYSDLFVWRGDEDYYAVSVPAGQTIVVDWTWTASSAVLRVMNNTCGEFAYELDGNWSWTNTSGAQTDLVLNFEVAQTGAECTNYAFDLAINDAVCLGAMDDAFEDNDTAAQAVPMGNGVQQGLFASLQDPDYFTTCVDPGQTLTAAIQFPDNVVAMDLEFINAPGTNYSYLVDVVEAEFTNTTPVPFKVVMRVSINPILTDCWNYDLSIMGADPCPPAVAEFCLPGGVHSGGGSTSLAGTFASGVGSGLHLEATGGPPGQFGYFLVSAGFTEPGGAIGDGRLCLTNPVGRYNGTDGGLPASSIGSFDASGRFVNLAGTSGVGSGFDVPTYVPLIAATITQGDTWNFQLWHRDLNPGPTVNFSKGLAVTF